MPGTDKRLRAYRIVILEHLGNLFDSSSHLCTLFQAVQSAFVVGPQVIYEHNAVLGVGTHALHCLFHDANVVELQGCRGVVAATCIRLEDHGPVMGIHANDADVCHVIVPVLCHTAVG